MLRPPLAQLGNQGDLARNGRGRLVAYGVCLTVLFCLANAYLILAMGGRALRFWAIPPARSLFLLGRYLESHDTYYPDEVDGTHARWVYILRGINTSGYFLHSSRTVIPNLT